jgi:hypothetical protein
MPLTYTLITSNVLGSSTASVNLSSIPSTYTDLALHASIRTDRASNLDLVGIRFNNDSNANYANTTLTGSGSGTPTSSNNNETYARENQVNGNSSLSNTFASLEMDINNYLASTNKPCSVFTVTEGNTTGMTIQAISYLWRNTAAITSIQLFPVTGPNFLTGSSFYLYGIKNS